MNSVFNEAIYLNSYGIRDKLMKPIGYNNSGLLLTIDTTKILDNVTFEFIVNNCKITKFYNDVIDGSNSNFRYLGNVFDDITYGSI